jgi:hypothetical protein
MSNEKEEFNVNREWNIKVNLSGLPAPTGKKRDLDVPEGYYKAKMMDMYINPERNPNRVVFKLEISEGPFSGVIRTDGMSVPKGDDDKVRYYWRGLAESAGYTPAQLDKGEITIGRDAFVDREVYVHLVPKEKTADGFEKIDYLAPAEWNQQRQVFAASQRADGTAAPLGAPPVADAGTTTKSDVLSKLGLGKSATA